MRRVFWLPLLLAACGGTHMLAERTPTSGELAVHDIQGNADSSLLVGRTIAVSGVVTADFQFGDADVRSDIGGFFLQSIEADSDAASIARTLRRSRHRR